MSELLGQLEGRERRAECLRNDEAMNGWRKCEFCGCNTNAAARACCQQGRNADATRAFFAECEAEARDVMRGAA